MGSPERVNMKIGAVINDASGTLTPNQAKERLDVIKNHLKGRVIAGCLSIVSGSSVENEIKRQISLGIDILVIGGGDGTISTAARLVRNNEITLVVLGLGTKNHFAHDLGLPLEPIEAIGLLDSMDVQRVDLGEVNGHIFINNATLGMYPKLVKEREEKTKKRGWRKWFAQIVAAIIVLWKIPRMKLVVEEKINQHSYLTPLLFVGNNKYEGRLWFNSNRASLNGGKLWVCAAQATGMISLLHIAWQLRLKGIQGIDNIETHHVSEVTVHSRRRNITVAIDGENCKMNTPLRFRILKKKLRVLVP